MRLVYGRPMYGGSLQSMHYLVIDDYGDARSACGMVLSGDGSGGFKMGAWVTEKERPNCSVCASCADKASKFVKSKLGDLPKNWKSPPKVSRQIKVEDHEYFDPQEDLILFQPKERTVAPVEQPKPAPVRRNSGVRTPYRPT